MSLVGKKILVLGGNGYVGNYFASRLVRQAASVFAMSRKGLKYEYPENAQVEWLVGDILNPAKFLPQINSADVIVHTIGTLFDTSVTKGTPAGGPGTYEQVNRDTLISLLNNLTSPKKIVYLSSNAHPPFLSRYLSTKYQAERLLLDSQHQGYCLRPGFIFNAQKRGWSIPIKHAITLWGKVYPHLHGMVPPQSFLQRAVEEFKQGDSVPLQELGDALVELCLNGSNKRVLETNDIHQLSIKLKSHQSKPSA